MIDNYYNSLSYSHRIEALPTYSNNNSGSIWKSINTSTPVVVLKLEHYESLGIIRSLGKLGIPVYGVDVSRFSYSSVSRYCRKTFVNDLENSNAIDTLNSLLEIGENLGKQAVLIPTSDETSLFVAQNAGRLKKHFLFNKNLFEIISTLCSKEENYYLAQGCGLSVPKSFFPKSLNDVQEISNNILFPVMLKGIKGGKLEKKTGRKMVIVKSRKELIYYYKSMEDFSEPNLMVQEYIPHTKNRMWIFNGYFDRSSNCLAAFTGLKIRQNPIYTGMTSLGICKWNGTLIKIAVKFLQDIRYSGPVDIDFVYDIRDGKYKILDVNPRVGASFRMFVGSNGIDVVRAMYLDITKQGVRYSKPPEGRKWFVEDKDLLSSLHYYKNSELKFSEWINSFSGVKEAGYFSLDDPVPFALLWFNHMRKNFFKLFEKIFQQFTFLNQKKNSIPKPVRYLSRHDQSSITNMFSNEAEQLKKVKTFFDRNDNWQGGVYQKNNDPHAMGVRRRIEYIFSALDKNYNLENMKALDIGCGPGFYINELKKRKADAFGIDVSEEMLKVCRRNCSGSVKLISGNVTSLPFENDSFDLVMCIGVLQYVVSIENAIAEINRVTKKGGLAIICFENMMAASNLGYSMRYYSMRFINSCRSKNNNGNNGFGIPSKWFLEKVSNPHLYKLYNPWEFAKITKRSGFKKVDGFTYGYPMNLLRKLKVIPSDSINSFEKRIETVLTKVKLPYLCYSGEFYIGIFQKEYDMNNSIQGI